MEHAAQRHSLWVATTDMPSYAPLAGDTRTQVLVIGGGMAGLQTAYLLKKAGVQVTLIERGLLGRGVSGHTTAKITALHALTYEKIGRMLGGEAASIYARANVVALEDIVDLVHQESIDCGLERDAACTYADTMSEREQIEREVEAAQAAGLPVEFREDLALPYPTQGGVWLAGQARFHPGSYMKALAQRLDGDGCSVHEHTVALDLDEDAGRVKTDQGIVSAGHIVIATHFPIFDHGPLALRVSPHRSYVVAARYPSPPAGMYISAADNYRSIRQHPAEGEPYLLLGGEHHHVGEGGDTRSHYDRLETWAGLSFSGAAVDFAWSTHDMRTNDSVPFIGRYRKGNERIWTATGFKGWGMTHSMVAARIISDRILGRPNDWAKLFDPWERSFLHGPGALFSQAATSVRSLVIDKVTSHDPACTHMGCTTSWNEAERSWDCPCHGSRFTESGEVLHGPAISPLGPTRSRQRKDEAI